MRRSFRLGLAALLAFGGCVPTGGPARQGKAPTASEPGIAPPAAGAPEGTGDAAALRRRATELWQAKKHERAAEALRKACQQAPDDPQNPVLLARVLLDGGRLDEARAVLTGASARWPAASTPQLLLGYALRRQKQWPQAEAAFRSALERAEAPAERLSAHLGLGAVLERLGRQAEADEQYGCAVAMDPELRDVLKEVETARLWPASVYTDDYHPLKGVGERLKRMEEKLKSRGQE